MLKLKTIKQGKSSLRYALTFWVSVTGLSLGTIKAHGENMERDDVQSYGYVGAPAVYPSNLVAFPGLSQTGGGVLFEMRFDPEQYTGDIIARSITSDGIISQDILDTNGFVVDDNANWRAHESLPVSPARKMFTSRTNQAGENLYNAPGRGIPFHWENLDQRIKDILISSNGEHDNGEYYGENLVDWIRGDSTHEGMQPGDFRSRMKQNHEGVVKHYPLPDMIHSSIQYVGPPSNLVSDAGYGEFMVENKHRSPMLYVGGNGGMMHAFRASDGVEMFAYIPQGLHGKLASLSDQNYTQDYYVDGSPTIMNAFGDFPGCKSVDPCWRTILVGGLGQGGNAVYALDVTHPEFVSEADAANQLFLWEFTEEDLGRSVSRPVIAKIHDGRWVAIFGNGFHQSGDSQGVLYIVDLTNGSVISKISVNAANQPNGILSPTAYDQNFDGFVDYVYAGDMQGNIWKFDLTPTDQNDNGVQNIDHFLPRVAYDGHPLVQIAGTNGANPTSLSMQTAPVVSVTHSGDIIVIFATDRVFDHENSDAHYEDSIFGILDIAEDDPDNPADATGHGIYPRDFSLNTYGFMTDINNVARTLSPESESLNAKGWRVNLEPGEKSLTDLVLTNRKLLFISTNTIENKNWLNGVDYQTGSTPEHFLDISGEGRVDENDLIDGKIPVSKNLGPGIVSSPTIVNIDGEADVNLITHGLTNDLGAGVVGEVSLDSQSDSNIVGASDDSGIEHVPDNPSNNHGFKHLGPRMTTGSTMNAMAIPSTRVSWREVFE